MTNAAFTQVRNGIQRMHPCHASGTLQMMDDPEGARWRGKSGNVSSRGETATEEDPVIAVLRGHIKDVKEFAGGGMCVVEDDGALYGSILIAAKGKAYNRPSSHFPEWAGFQKYAQKGYDLQQGGTILFGLAERTHVSKRAWAMSWIGQVSTKEYYGKFTWFQTEGAGVQTWTDTLTHTVHATVHFMTATMHAPLQFGMSGTSWQSEKTGNEDYRLKED